MWFTKKKRPRTPLPAEGRPPGLLGGVFLAYGIVVLHLSLIAMAILLVLMANGVVNYFIWLLLGGLGLLCGGIWLFLKKLKTKRRTLRRLLQLPELRGKIFEISFLGGAAALRVGDRPGEAVDIPSLAGTTPPLLTDKARSPVADMGELSRLYENDLITREEFERLKSELMKTMGKSVAS